MMRQNRLIGILLVLVAGLSWSAMCLFLRGLDAAGLASRSIAAFRSMLACLFFGLLMLAVKRDAFRVRLRDIWCLAGCGLGSITLFNILYFNVIARTTVGVAIVLLYTSPIFVTLLSCLFFKEAFTWRKGLALVLVVIGCILITGILGGDSQAAPTVTLPVLLMGLGSGLCYALYSIFGRFAQNRGYSSETITLYAFIFAGCAGVFLLDWHQAMPLIAARPSLCWQLAGLVVFCTVLPYFTYVAGMRNLLPSTAAIIATIEPVMGTLLGILVFHETLTASSLLGMILILAAIFIP